MFYSFLSDQLASFDSGWVLNSFTTPIAILVRHFLCYLYNFFAYLNALS